MLYREYFPQAALQNYIECFWTGGAASSKAHQVLPDGCMDILFRIPRSGVKEKASAYVVGTMQSAIWVPPSETEIVAVRFKAGGAAPFLRIPAYELTDKAEPLEYFFGPSANVILDKLLHADPQNRVTLLQAELMNRLSLLGPADKIIIPLVERLLRVEAIPTVNALSKIAGVGTRQLERKFLNSVGISPKMFLRVLRLQRATKRVREGHTENWAELAVSCGYYDQAHLNREFKLLTQETPTQYLAQI